jgi:hypothetical protein
MSLLKKISALIGASAVAAFGFASAASAAVTVMAEDGWKVTFDGSVNSFYVNTSEERAKPSKSGAGLSLQLAGDMDRSGITVGLLPAVFAMNVHAPTMNGLDMKARLGLYPSTQNNQVKNQGNSDTGGQNGSNLDLREIYFAVDGDYGQFLVGRTLSLFLGKNILTDMTLFGVGAVSVGGGGGIGGGTTLGRIGYGYVYPNFNAAIRYSTPNMEGFQATVGVYNPSRIDAGGGGTFGGGKAFTASETKAPRFEGELSFASDVDGVGVSAWVNGMFQSADFTTAEKAICKANADAATSKFSGLEVAPPKFKCSGDVDAWGFGGGLQLSYMGLALTGSGYTGEALGNTLMLNGGDLSAAVDAVGEEREHYGYIAQITYDFGQGTNFGVSYGSSFADESRLDKAALRWVNAQTPAADANDAAKAAAAAAKATVTLGIEEQTLLDVMIWHNINSNLRVVAEYGRQETEWFDGSEQDVDIISVGGFFFW